MVRPIVYVKLFSEIGNSECEIASLGILNELNDPNATNEQLRITHEEQICSKTDLDII